MYCAVDYPSLRYSKFLPSEISLYAVVANYQGNLFNVINWNPDPLNSCSTFHVAFALLKP